MSRFMKVIIVLLLCWAAAAAVRGVHNSEAWQQVLMFAIGLPWPSIEAARISSHVLEALLGALLGGAFSTLLVVTTRLSAGAAAATLSTAVFLGSYPAFLLSALGGGNADFLVGLVKMTAAFFVGGWLIAALGSSLLVRKNSSGPQQENSEESANPK